MSIRCVKQIGHLYNQTNDAKVSSDGSRLAIPAPNDAIVIFDTATWEIVQQLQQHNWMVTIDWHPEGRELVTAGLEGLTFWNTETGEMAARFKMKVMRSVGYLPDGRRLLAGDGYGRIHLLTRDEHKLDVADAGDGGTYANVYGIVVLNNSRALVVASNDTRDEHTLAMYGIKNDALSLIWRRQGVGNWSKPSLVYDGQYVLIGSNGSTTMDCWDVREKQLSKQYKRDSNNHCKGIMLGVDNEYVVGGSAKNVVVWYRESGEQVACYDGHTENITGLLRHPHSPFTFYSFDGASIRVWEFGMFLWMSLMEVEVPDREAYVRQMENKKQASMQTIDPRDLRKFLLSYLTNVEENQLVLDQYRISHNIGEGGGSMIWAAIDEDLDQAVALKFYTRNDAYEQEIKFLKMFNHPSIMRHMDAMDAEACGVALTVQPLAEKSLQDVFLFGRPLKVLQLKGIVETMVEVLAVLQQNNVVNCDLKPANLLLFRDPSGFPQWKLIDFDAAVTLNEPVERGTLDFCAPEVFKLLSMQTTPKGAFSMDMFSLGRIVMWLAVQDDSMWPNLGHDCTDADKEAFLISEDEFNLEAIPDDATRNIVQRLVKKRPEDRLTLQELQATTYIRMDKYTKTLRLNK
jgi:WD40 repeat protein